MDMSNDLQAIKTFLDKMSDDAKALIILRATEWGVTPPMALARILDDKA